jgi:two-component system CheB/CheR fusion protein
VLVVDDYPDAAESLGLLLRLWGYDVRVAATGLDALNLAPVYLPHVVLSELRMQGLSGYQMAQRLRENAALQQAVFIALTTLGREADRKRSQEASFAHHLIKPADPSELRELLLRAAKVFARPQAETPRHDPAAGWENLLPHQGCDL